VVTATRRAGIGDPALLSIGHRYPVILMPLLNLCQTHYDPVPADASRYLSDRAGRIVTTEIGE